MHVFVDGMNVIGSRPDGWWRNRGGARSALVARLEAVVDGDTGWTVVFDGRPGPGEAERCGELSLEVVYAPGGRNAADDVIVTLVKDVIGSDQVTVVTSDVLLAERVRSLGARVETAGAFRSRLAI